MPDGNTVRHLERKQGHVPRVDTVERIARALGLAPSFLAYGLDGECKPTGALDSAAVGARLRALRLDRGLTMRALARLAGLTDTAVRTTETGTTVPSVATVEALANALAVSPGWLAYAVGPMDAPRRRRSRTAAGRAESAPKP